MVALFPKISQHYAVTSTTFAFIFIGVVIFNSFSILPKSFVDAILNIDTLMLAMAMAALGLTTHVSAIRNAGIRPLILAAVLFAWLIGGGALINNFVTGILQAFGIKAVAGFFNRAAESLSCLSLEDFDCLGWTWSS